MNCETCRDNLVAWMENALDNEFALQCRAHLETCADCRAEYAAISRLQERLILRGQAAAEVSLVDPVMRRIHGMPQKQESETFMSRLFTRWGFGLGAAVGTAAIAMAFLLVSPESKATATQVMTKGIQAASRLTGIHLQGRIRSRPAENFANIESKQDFTTIELWRECGGGNRWRAEKPGRLAVMDGAASMLYLKPIKKAFKYPPSQSAFDTDWLHQIANLEQTLETELRLAQAQGWKMTVTSEPGISGVKQAVVAIEAKSGLPDNDYLKNRFFNTADTRRVYRFNEISGQLEGAQVYMHESAGDVLVFEMTSITYNPVIAAEVFRFDIPENVTWNQEPQVPADNARYAAMTSDQTARTFFEACGKENWKEVNLFANWLSDDIQAILAGIQIVSIGTPYTSEGYPGQFVPYEIRFKNGEVKKFNLALKKDAKTGRWMVDGGI